MATGDNQGRTLDARSERLEALARRITDAQLAALAVAMRDESVRTSVWPADERFWFSDKGGTHLAREEDQAIRHLWTRVQVGLTFAVTGVEIPRRKKRGPFAWLLGTEQTIVEGEAAILLERHGGGDIWLPVTGVWNGFCAALLSERLDPKLRAALETPWRIALGATPREMLGM